MQKSIMIKGMKYYIFECECGLFHTPKFFKNKSGEWTEEKMSNFTCNRCMSNFVEVMENE